MDQRFPPFLAELPGELTIVQMLVGEGGRKVSMGDCRGDSARPTSPRPSSSRLLQGAGQCRQRVIFSPQTACAEVNGSSLMLIIFVCNCYG